MFIKIDHSSKLPIYVQIKNQISYMVSTGALKEGDKIPSVRELASALKVNPTSTVRAFRELEYEGIIRTKQGSGTFISENAPKTGKAERIRAVSEEIKKVLATARLAGLAKDEIQSLFEEELKLIGGYNERAD
jgi:GntR family transcriptional regulator